MQTYCMHSFIKWKAKEDFLTPTQANANSSSFICESIFLQKTEEAGEKGRIERQSDDVQEEIREGGREALCWHRVGSARKKVRGEKGEARGRLKPVRRWADKVCLEGITADW